MIFNHENYYYRNYENDICVGGWCYELQSISHLDFTRFLGVKVSWSFTNTNTVTRFTYSIHAAEGGKRGLEEQSCMKVLVNSVDVS
jgi:hypothetical protein